MWVAIDVALLLCNTIVLRMFKASRPGVCPQPLTEEVCEEGESPECVTDMDCVSPSKCCSDGCIKACAEPDIEEPAVDKSKFDGMRF